MKQQGKHEESPTLFSKIQEKLLRTSFFIGFSAIFAVGYIFALSYPSTLPPEISTGTGNITTALNTILLSGDFNNPWVNWTVKDTAKLGWQSGYQKKISQSCTGINVIKSFNADGTVGCGTVTRTQVCSSIPANAARNTATSITQTRAGGSWTPSPSSVYSTTASATNCVYTCSASFHTENAWASCVSNTRSCAITNGAGSQTWNGASWNTCTPISCNAGYTVSGNSCMQSCLLPWGGSIIHGASTTAYASSSVVYPSSCTSQSRTCSNGTLGGSYASRSCGVTYTYAWSSGGFGSCSATCGGGTQTRTVVCQRNDGTTVADANCGGWKPAVSQSCNTQACVTLASDFGPVSYPEAVAHCNSLSPGAWHVPTEGEMNTAMNLGTVFASDSISNPRFFWSSTLISSPDGKANYNRAYSQSYKWRGCFNIISVVICFDDDKNNWTNGSDYSGYNSMYVRCYKGL